MPKQDYFNFALIKKKINISHSKSNFYFKKQLILVIVTVYKIVPDFTF